MPRIDDMFDETGGCQAFLCIDLIGYRQVPLEEEYKQCIAFVSTFGVYNYNCLPFRQKNSDARFQSWSRMT